MRYVLSLALVLSMVAMFVGCEKKNNVQASSTQQPPTRNMETLTPPAPPTVANEPPPPPPLPKERTYTIQKGDTLWSIAVGELGDGKRHKEISELNPGIKPNALRIGTVIKLPAE